MPKRILLDHGANYNIGDIAQLENVALRLLHNYPDTELYITDPPNLKTSLWDNAAIHRQKYFRVNIPGAHAFSNLPFAWRYDESWRRMVSNVALLYSERANMQRLFPVTYCDNDSKNSLDLKEYCKGFDGLVISGGGFFNDTLHYTLIEKCSLINAFISKGAPVMLTGQQIGPFKSTLTKKLLKKTLKKVSFIGLRDPGYSLTFCEDAGINRNTFGLMGDDSLGAPCAPETTIETLLKNNQLEAGNFLAVNVRLSNYNREVYAHIKNIASLFEKLAERLQMPLVFIPIAFNTQDSGIAAAKVLVKHMPGNTVKILQCPNQTPAITKGILKKAYAAVGVSYHFCVFALSQGTPAVCMHDGAYYGQKAKNISLFWQDHRLSLDLSKTSVDGAGEQIMKVSNDAALREKIKGISEKALLEWQNIFDNRLKELMRQ